MVKIKNKKKLLWAFRQFQTKKRKQKWLSSHLKITPQWFRILYKRWLETGEIKGSKRSLGRPKIQTSPDIEKIILDEYKYTKNALYLEKVLYAKYKLRVAHNRIHNFLMENNLAKKARKKRRKKKWVRYERTNCLSAGHIDWHVNKKNKQFCAIIDDSSRKILAAGEFDKATTQNSIKLMDEVIEKYSYIKIIREIISDHGSQFCANKINSKGRARHTFREYLNEKGIRQILCRIRHPQSNGKIEKFFHLYDRFRFEFESLDEFIEWYNDRPHGSLNLRLAETPNMAFERRIPTEYWFGKAVGFLNI